MQIKPSTLNDIDVIMSLYDQASVYQRSKGYNIWLGFDQKLIESEIKQHRHFKIEEDGEIACIFTVAYHDQIIWGEKDQNDSIYLHRIATNSNFRGRGYLLQIVEWTKEQCTQMGKKYVRLDTWANNDSLKNYYTSAGFTHIGQIAISETADLPKHYHGIELNLFEIVL
jgi:ribosomal protein S18 acetylase RimI-like enzyme